jgi:hypothetical protein
MKRWLLTLPILLAGMAGVVRADYFLMVIYTGSPPPAGMGMVGTQPMPMTNPADYVGVIVENDFGATAHTAIEKAKFENQGAALQVKYRGYPTVHITSVSTIGRSILSYTTLYGTGDRPANIRIFPNVHRRFAHKLEENKNKAPTLELAEWALTHGLIDKFAESMDKLSMDEKEKDTPAVVAYLKIKPLVNSKVERDPDSPWVARLKNGGFKAATSDHYLLLHNVDDKYKNEVKSRQDRFEEAFKTFYYWNALKGKILPVPKERLLVILGEQEENELLKEFRTVADGGDDRLSKRREDGFFARREGIVYLSLASREPTFEKLSAFVENKIKDSKIKTVDEWLKEKHSLVRPGNPDPWVLALAVKAADADAERLVVSHQGSRQLAYAAGFLPRYVVAPEWIQYGMGSFFETPLGSPWACPTVPSAAHLKACQDIFDKESKSGPPAELLKQIVSDGYFRQAVSAGEKDPTAALAKARALAWGLTYYLVQKDESRRLAAYREELDKMPRDLALDPEVLLSCFARAVGAVDSNDVHKIDPDKFNRFASEWKAYIKETSSDKEAAEVTAALKASIDKLAKK